MHVNSIKISVQFWRRTPIIQSSDNFGVDIRGYDPCGLNRSFQWACIDPVKPDTHEFLGGRLRLCKADLIEGIIASALEHLAVIHLGLPVTDDVDHDSSSSPSLM